jgi:hypothetical protein
MQGKEYRNRIKGGRAFSGEIFRCRTTLIAFITQVVPATQAAVLYFNLYSFAFPLRLCVFAVKTL